MNIPQHPAVLSAKALGGILNDLEETAGLLETLSIMFAYGEEYNGLNARACLGGRSLTTAIRGSLMPAIEQIGPAISNGEGEL